MENFDEEKNESDDESDESESDYDSSGDEGVAYTVASKADFEPIEVKTKVKTRKNETTEAVNDENNEVSETKEASEADNWTQSQQKALESAIKQFPKGTTERWERIANKVPSKTKDQCIQRFKTLAEMVKKKKENRE